MDRLCVNNSSWRPPGSQRQQPDDQQPSKSRHFAHNTFPATNVITASDKMHEQTKMPQNTSTGRKSSLLQSDNRNGGKERRFTRSSYHGQGLRVSLSCFIVLSCVLFFSSQFSTVSAQANPGHIGGLHAPKELRVLARNKLRWARSTTEAPPVGGENDGDLAASGDRSFAYTERVLFSPESRARVHLPPATIPIIDRAINDRSTNVSGQRSFSERVGQASAVISDAAESGPFSLPFGLRLKNGGGNNGTGGRKFAALQEIIKPSNIRKRNFSASITTVLSETSEDGGGGIGGKKAETVAGANNQLAKVSTKDDKQTTTTTTTTTSPQPTEKSTPQTTTTTTSGEQPPSPSTQSTTAAISQSTEQSAADSSSSTASAASGDNVSIESTIQPPTTSTTTTKRLRSPTARQRFAAAAAAAKAAENEDSEEEIVEESLLRVRNGVKARGRLRLRSSLPGFFSRTSTTPANSDNAENAARTRSSADDERKRDRIRQLKLRNL